MGVGGEMRKKQGDMQLDLGRWGEEGWGKVGGWGCSVRSAHGGVVVLPIGEQGGIILQG